MNCNRWSNWTPKPENAQSELAEVGSGGSGGAFQEEISINPVSWGEELHKWMITRCEFKDRCFGGINSLYSDWRKWIFDFYGEVENKEFLSRAGFYLQILGLGFSVADGLVYGLTLPDFCIHPWNEPPKPSQPVFRSKSGTHKTFTTPTT